MGVKFLEEYLINSYISFPPTPEHFKPHWFSVHFLFEADRSPTPGIPKPDFQGQHYKLTCLFFVPKNSNFGFQFESFEVATNQGWGLAFPFKTKDFSFFLSFCFFCIFLAPELCFLLCYFLCSSLWFFFGAGCAIFCAISCAISCALVCGFFLELVVLFFVLFLVLFLVL